MKTKFYLIALSTILLTSCGEQTEQEAEAFENLVDVIKELPNETEEQKANKEFAEEENAHRLEGTFKLVDNDGEQVISSWVSKQSKVNLMDNIFTIRSVSTENDDARFVITIMSPDLFEAEFPITTSVSMMEKSYTNIMYSDANGVRYSIQSGEATIHELSSEKISMSFIGKALKGESGDPISLSIDMDMEFNFISQDLRTSK